MRACPSEWKDAAQPADAALSSNGLPSLDSAFAGRDRADTASLLRLLRKIAHKVRQKQPRPFYSIRTVARRFDVPLTTVARVYAQLKKEGILASVWGSNTVVEPHELNRELRMRGTVALPACLKSFYALRNYRSLFENMQVALWKTGFATRQLFYENGNATKPDFNETLLNQKVDVVLWLLPDPAVLAGRKRLLDRGVRVVSAIESLIANARTEYVLSRLHAFQEVVNLWKLKGVRLVTIVQESGSEPPAALDTIEACLDGLGMAHASATAPSGSTGQARSLYRKNDTAFIFPQFESALRFACEHPRNFALLLNQHPVLLVEGMLDLPIDFSSCVDLEVIEFDWRPVVNRLIGDLLKWNRLPAGKPMVFHAKRIQQVANGYAAAA
jgi:hypothetical protein